MGKTIVSWSPVHGQGMTTSNIAALAAQFALTNEHHSVIMHTQLNYSSLELLFGKQKSNVLGFEESGLVAIERLIESNLIKPEAVHDYTETIYAKRLDLLGGSYPDNEGTEKMLATLLKVVGEAYDLVWIDAHSGTRSEVTRRTLLNADIIIVNLPQNRFVLDRFFTEEYPPELEGKEVLILISQYNDNSQFGLRKIKRKYNIKEPVFAIPYSKQFRDASNNLNIADYFYTRAVRTNKLSPSDGYIAVLNKVNKHISKKLAFSNGDEE